MVSSRAPVGLICDDRVMTSSSPTAAHRAPSPRTRSLRSGGPSRWAPTGSSSTCVAPPTTARRPSRRPLADGRADPRNTVANDLAGSRAVVRRSRSTRAMACSSTSRSRTIRPNPTSTRPSGSPTAPSLELSGARSRRSLAGFVVPTGRRSNGVGRWRPACEPRWLVVEIDGPERSGRRGRAATSASIRWEAPLDADTDAAAHARRAGGQHLDLRRPGADPRS